MCCMTPTPRYLSTGEVAALFQVDDSTVMRWARTGKIPSYPLPSGLLRYVESEILALLPGAQPIAAADDSAVTA